MARPLKAGLGYYPLDVDVFEDTKLFKIQNKYGPLGESVYLRLLCMVYKEGYYLEVDLDTLSLIVLKSIGARWGRTEETVKQVILELAECGLIDKDCLRRGCITSVGIQRRYLRATERRQLYSTKYWLLNEATESFSIGENRPETPVIVTETPVIATVSTQRREKKRKEKERRESMPPSASLSQPAAPAAEEPVSKEALAQILPGAVELDCAPKFGAEKYRRVAEELGRSQWLGLNATRLSVIHRKLAKILDGFYRDYRPVAVASTGPPSPVAIQNSVPNRVMSATELNAMFDNLDAEDM